ncbi:peptidase family C78-domain-containing protein [Mycena galopus ATCC 62051]|nr:peptidase family C78-domain-containing protein [Mycena galopus ATCC 62051]
MSYTLSGGRIEPNSTPSFQCQFCSANLDQLSVHQREQHYEKHLHDDLTPTVAGSFNGVKPVDKKPTNSESSKKFSWPGWGAPKDQDHFWYPAQTSQPPKNFTPGLISLLKTHLNKSHTGGYTRRAVLCYDRVVLVTREIWDAGWGCGYRNFLMACTALMDQQMQPMYFPLLDSPSPPSVRNLQQWIEGAWDDGFDPEGARQLRPLVGSKKWIGTSDVQVAFTARGIPSKLVDFDLKTNARGATLLTDWVVEYFSQPHGMVDSDSVVENSQPKTAYDVLRGASPVTVTCRMPLILQHAGHSRTIVGYEVNKAGLVNLLVFDPSKIPKKALHQAGLEAFSAMTPRHVAPLNTTINAVASSSKRPGTSLSSNNPLPLKRSRVDNQGSHLQPGDDDDDDVIVISDSDDENLPQRVNLSPKKKADDGKQQLRTRDVLQFFRLDPKKLEKKKAYQVLYFPLSAPLDEAEIRRARNMNIYGEKIS